MSVTRQWLKNSVRTLCGEPADLPLPDGLPNNLIFEELTSIETEMLRDLDLSSQSRRVDKVEVSLTTDSDEFAISAGDFNAPAFAYVQTDVNSPMWYPVEIVDHAGITQAGINGVLAVSIVGSTGYTSWISDGSHTLRLWYERNGMDDPALAESTELGNLYDGYLKLQTAAQCMEHLGRKIGDVMAARLVKSERQWQRYVNRGRQRGQGTKNPVFVPSRFRRSYSYVDRTRFFVP